MDFIIDPGLEKLGLPLRPDLLAGLEEDILEYGVRHPLEVWQEEGVLLDGHNRYAIAERHGIPYEVKEISLPDRAAAELFVLRSSLNRRNLEKKEKRLLIAQIKRREGMPNGGDRKAQYKNCTVKSAGQIAEEAGMSRMSVFNAEQWASAVETAPKDVISDMLRGRWPDEDVIATQGVEPIHRREELDRLKNERRVREKERRATWKDRQDQWIEKLEDAIGGPNMHDILHELLVDEGVNKNRAFRLAEKLISAFMDYYVVDEG